MKTAPESSSLLRLLLLTALPLSLGALILMRLAPDFVLRWAHCPLRETTGVPCPTCGGTLAATHLVQGHWLTALAANPLVVLAAALGAAALLWATAATLVPVWRRYPVFSATQKRTAKWLAVLLLILNWAWLARRYLG